MNRSDEMPHIRSAFRQCADEAAKIKLVERIRDEALKFLPPAVIAKVPPPYFSDEARATYKAKGVSLEWNLTILGATGVYAFCFAAHDAGLTPGQLRAVDLLNHCTKALEVDTVSEQLQCWILDAYAGLDADAVVTGKKFTQGRKSNTGSIIRKAIAKLLKADATLKNPVLWTAVATKPPRGWTAHDNHLGKYLEGVGTKNMNYERFCTVCGEERKKIKLKR